MSTENPFQYDNCPECGMPSFMHDGDAKRHICVNEECGYVVEESDSVSKSLLMRILRKLRLKR